MGGGGVLGLMPGCRTCLVPRARRDYALTYGAVPPFAISFDFFFFFPLSRYSSGDAFSSSWLLHDSCAGGPSRPRYIANPLICSCPFLHPRRYPTRLSMYYSLALVLSSPYPALPIAYNPYRHKISVSYIVPASGFSPGIHYTHHTPYVVHTYIITPTTPHPQNEVSYILAIYPLSTVPHTPTLAAQLPPSS